jgi:hypothetical protein
MEITTMNRMRSNASKYLLSCIVYLLMACAVATTSTAQDNAPSQIGGVDQTKMGAYRKLAQLSLQAFQKRDYATAAALARILERAWDKSEGCCCEGSLGKANLDLQAKIDEAMDLFIKPIIGYAKMPPDPSKVEVAFNDFMDKLKQGDQ